MQPKVIQNLRPYYTYMHLRSATFKDRGRIRQGFWIQHWYHVIILGFWDWNTLRHKQKDMDTVKSTLKRMNHQIITMAVWGRGRREGEAAALRSVYYKIKLHFPQPIKRGPEGWDGFHLVSSPSIRVSKLKTLYPPHFYQFNIKSALAQYISHQALFTPSPPQPSFWGFLGTKWDSSSFTWT